MMLKTLEMKGFPLPHLNFRVREFFLPHLQTLRTYQVPPSGDESEMAQSKFYT